MFRYPALCFLLTLLLFTVDGLRRVGSSKVPAGGGSPGLERTSSIITDQTLNQVSHSHTPEKKRRLSVRAEAVFALNIRVKDTVSHLPLSQASVDVFMNYTLISSSMTDSDGLTLLHLQYTPYRTLTLVANKAGYIQTILPWTTTKMPIFSSVTLSLFPQNQGNIWLYEDSVHITGQISDVVPQPTVQFPKSLLSLSDSNISTLTAFLTGPQLPAEKHYFPHTTGIIISKSGIRSIELNPEAAVSVQLLYDGRDVQVTGPIQITLPLSDPSRSQASDTIPAWSYNKKTGAWVNRGLGIVRLEDKSLVWVYVAPHLGYWIAARFPSATGYMGHESTLNFISYHPYLLTATLSGILLIAVGLFGVMSCYCRGSPCRPVEKKTNTTKTMAQKKDQTTSTNSDDHLEICFRDPVPKKYRSHSDTYQSTCHSDGSVDSEMKEKSYVGKTGYPTLQIYENIAGIALEPSSPSQSPLYVNSSEIRLLCPQPMSAFRVLEHFPLLEQQGCRSAILPRKGIHYAKVEKQCNKDTFTQAVPNTPLLSDSQQQVKGLVVSKESPYEEPGSCSTPGAWSCFNGLLESVSVPETLNEATGLDTICHQRVSEQAVLKLTKTKPFPHPRAWFVSLEGKPAAQICHSIVDLQKSHLLSNSNDNSLDSGVDLHEHRQRQEQGCKRSLAHSHALGLEDRDLSGSESGTTAACSLEELTSQNTLTSSSWTISNLPERTQVSLAQAHKSNSNEPRPLVHRFRKESENSRVNKAKSHWHQKEDRPLMKLN